jgi:hypothetical protein
MIHWEMLKKKVKKMFKRPMQRRDSIESIPSDVYKPLDWTLERKKSLDLMFNSLSIERCLNQSSLATNVHSDSSETEACHRISNHQLEREPVDYVPTRSLATLVRQKSKIKRPYKRKGVYCERSSDDSNILPISSNLQQVDDRLVFKFRVESNSDGEMLSMFSSDEEEW